MIKYIQNNAWVTVNNAFWVTNEATTSDFHEWRSHEWKLSANRITSDPKSLFMVTNVLFYFLHAILYPWTHKIADFAIVARDGLFWFNIVTSLVVLWRHTNAGYWQCDVTFFDCFCTRKLAQKRSPLVNNNREYRILTTRYSRLGE